MVSAFRVPAHYKGQSCSGTTPAFAHPLYVGGHPAPWDLRQTDAGIFNSPLFFSAIAGRRMNTEESGERGRNRTFNLLIKSQLLCQLSYAPTVGVWLVGRIKIIASATRSPQNGTCVTALRFANFAPVKPRRTEQASQVPWIRRFICEVNMIVRWMLKGNRERNTGCPLEDQSSIATRKNCFSFDASNGSRTKTQ